MRPTFPRFLYLRMVSIRLFMHPRWEDLRHKGKKTTKPQVEMWMQFRRLGMYPRHKHEVVKKQKTEKTEKIRQC